MAEGLMQGRCRGVHYRHQSTQQSRLCTGTVLGIFLLGVRADLGDAESLECGFQSAVEKLGGHLDILVNGAGVQKRHPSAISVYETGNL